MKALEYILNLLSVIFFIACSGDKEVASPLTDVESLIIANPDSAYTLLELIENPEKLSGNQYPLWCLLKTQAIDKLGIKHTSDSLIQVAVNYYEESDLANRKMLANYYCGRVFQDLNDAPQAQEYYLKALDAGQDLDDHYLLGRLYANLGTLYIFQEIYQAALDFEKKAFYHFQQLKDSVSQSQVLMSIARVHVCENRLDSAISYYKKALLYTEKKHNLYIVNELADTYNKAGNFEEGFHYANIAYTKVKTREDSCLVSFTLGDLYLNSGQVDSANQFLCFSLGSSNIHTLAGAYNSLSQLEKEKGNFKKYAFFQEKYKELNDSIGLQNRMETLSRNQSLYDYQQVVKKRDYYRQESHLKTIRFYKNSLYGVVIFVLIIVYIFYLFHKHRNEEEQLNQSLRIKDQEYKISQDYLKDKEASLGRLKELLELERQKKEKNVAELSEQLKIEQHKKEELVADLSKQLAERHQKIVEIEDQYKKQLKVELEEKSKIEKMLTDQINSEQQEKIEIENQYKRQLKAELEEKIKIEKQLKDQIKAEQQKKKDIEDQYKVRLNIENQEKENTVKMLTDEIKAEQQKKEEIEKRLDLTLKMVNESKNRLLSKRETDIKAEEALFRDSDEYIGLYSGWTKIDDEKWALIIDRIDYLLYNGFTRAIKCLYPGISEHELRICYLIKLKIPVKRIALLLNTSSQSISNSRTRMLTKFTGKKGTTYEFDEFILNLNG